MRRRLLTTALCALALAGCGQAAYQPLAAPVPPASQAAGFHCCHDPERMPGWFVDIAKEAAEELTPVLARFDAHDGMMAPYPEARAAVMTGARPFDVIVVSNKGRKSGSLITGHFTHAAIYLGTEDELRAAKLWTRPAMAPLRDDIRAGRVILESIATGVHMVSPETLLDTDAATRLRPTLSRAEKIRALDAMAQYVGAPFDPLFDMCSEDKVACTELLARVLPGQEYPLRHAYGSQVLIPDDIVAKAIRGDRARLMSYAFATPDGWEKGDITDAMAHIRAFWGPSPAVAGNEVRDCPAVCTR